MSTLISKLNNNLPGLPPNVKGTTRGHIVLNFQGIRWSSRKLSGRVQPKTLIGTQFRIIWWGENFQSGSLLRINPQPSDSIGSVGYDIRTNRKLFFEYLTYSEPIEIKLTSFTNRSIGTVFVRIPEKLIEFFNPKSIELQVNPIVISSHERIFNGQNQHIGILDFNFHVHFTDSNYVDTPTQSLQKEQENDVNILNNINNIRTGVQNVYKEHPTISKQKPSIHILPDRLITNCDTPISSLRLKCNAKYINVSKSDTVFNYLTGRDMTVDQEVKALYEIQSISPTESMIEELNQVINSPTKSTETVASIKSSDRINFDSQIDSFRINIKHVSLSRAAIREIAMKTNSTLTTGNVAHSFIVECKLDWLHHAQTRRPKSKRDYNDVLFRAVSDDVTDLAEQIKINRDTIFSIKVLNSDRTSGATISFTVWWRIVGQRKQPTVLGTGSAPFIDTLDSLTYTTLRKHRIKSTTAGIWMGAVLVKLELGCRGVHFGQNFIDAVSQKGGDSLSEIFELSSSCGSVASVAEDRSGSSGKQSPRSTDDLSARLSTAKKLCSCALGKTKSKLPKIGCNIESNANDCKRILKTTSNISMIGPPTNRSNNASNINLAAHKSSIRQFSRNDILVENSDNSEKRIFYGFIYFAAIEHLFKKDVRFLTYLQSSPNGINCTFKTGVCQNNMFNFSKTFPILWDESFLKRLEKREMLVGVFKDVENVVTGTFDLPLHQYHIAYKDIYMVNRLQLAQLPVISTDGWVNITSFDGTDIYARIQCLMAIGTKTQIEYLKMIRQITNPCETAKDFFVNKRPMNNMPTIDPLVRTTQSTQIPFTAVQNVDSKLKQNNAETQTNVSAIKSNSLARLEKLRRNVEAIREAQSHKQIQLSDNNKNSDNTTQNNQPNLSCSPNSKNQSPGPQFRRTSDLLDALQRALMCPPDPKAKSIISDTIKNKPPPMVRQLQAPNVNNVISPITDNTLFEALVEIEHALRLSKISMRVNKKSSKRNKSNGRGLNEQEPSTYVVFSGYGPPTSIVQSAEGMVYTTDVVEKDCNPEWNKRFKVKLPKKLLLNDPVTHLIFKVYRKQATDIPQARLLPNPQEDQILGIVLVDLRGLTAGMPSISGWYNIMNYMGVHGQIKLSITPLEDIRHLNDSLMPTTSSSLTSMAPLTIDVSDDDTETDSLSLGCILKKKFTELDEITQRLRARLSDVTSGDDDILDDPEPNVYLIDGIEQLDQFEEDLNTCPPDNEDIEPGGYTDNFEWLRNSATSQIQSDDLINLQATTNALKELQEKAIDLPVDQIERHVSGCSMRSEPIQTLCKDFFDTYPLVTENLIKHKDIRSMMNDPNFLDDIPIDEIANNNNYQQEIDNIDTLLDDGGSGHISLNSGSSSLFDSRNTVEYIANALRNAAIVQNFTIDNEQCSAETV